MKQSENESGMSDLDASIIKRFETALTTLIGADQKDEQAVFQAAAKALGDALGYRWTGVGRYDETAQAIDLLAFYADGNFSDCFSYPILNTPCADVYRGQENCFFENAAEAFPDDQWLQKIGAKAYQGTLIHDGDQILGHVFAIHDRQGRQNDFSNFLLRLAARWIEKEVRYRRALRDLKYAEERARQAQKTAEDANATKSKFMANMNHELRTPMNAILGFSQLIEASCEGEEMRQIGDYAHDIVESGYKMISLIEKIMDFTRSQKTESELTIKNLDATSFIPNLIRRSHYDDCRDRIDLLMPNTELVLQADPGELERVIAHLLDNAIRFSEPDSKVSLQLASGENHQAVIQIQDHGPGMDKGMIEQAFEPFYRGGDPMVAGKSGSGLGLAICRQLVRAMRGDIRLRSRPGHGCCAIVTLPMSHSEAEKDPFVPAAPSKSAVI